MVANCLAYLIVAFSTIAGIHLVDYNCESGSVSDPNSAKKCIPLEQAGFIIINNAIERRIFYEPLKPKDQENGTIAKETSLWHHSIDYHYKKGDIYWSDMATSRLFRSTVKSSLDVNITDSLLHPINVHPISKVAVDWIYDHLYWLANTTISVSNLDGDNLKTIVEHKTPDNYNASKLLAIAVDPIEGYLFWTQSHPAKLMRSGLDGSNEKTLLTLDTQANEGYPDSISLDYAKKTVYWADGEKHTISACSYDGQNQRLVFKTEVNVRFRTNIAVFQDQIYFTCFRALSFFSVPTIPKKSPQNETAIKIPMSFVLYPTAMNIYHPSRQPAGTNYCASNQCSHLCFPQPKSAQKFVCACPTGMKLKDNKTCISQ